MFFNALKRRKAANENTTIQSSIRDFEVLEMGEILQLEKRLQNQFAVRCALENALGSGVSSYEKNEPSTIPKLATNFIKEIAVLELEVGYLEQYLLSLHIKRHQFLQL